MRTDPAQYQSAIRVCLACWYIDLVPGIVPAKYAFTRGHNCPKCGKPKLRIDVILFKILNQHIIVMLLARAMTTASLYYIDEIKSIERKLILSGALR